MKTLMRLCVVSTLGLGLGARAEADAKVLGLWLSENEDGIIELFMHEDELRGRLVWIAFPNDCDGKAQKDVNNPQLRRRDLDIVGMTMVWGFKRNHDGGWDNGWIYDPNNGKTYKCQLRREGEDSVHIRGYVLLSLLGRTTNWKRLSPEQFAALADRAAQENQRNPRCDSDGP